LIILGSKEEKSSEIIKLNQNMVDNSSVESLKSVILGKRPVTYVVAPMAMPSSLVLMMLFTSKGLEKPRYLLPRNSPVD
jgi:hypothetical protein